MFIVFGIQNREIFSGLIGKDSGFDAAILGKRPVIIDMIAGDIQKNGNEGPELIDPLQLKTADFSHDKIGILIFICVFNQRIADISADKNFLPRFLQNFTQQGGSSRFTVGARYGDNRNPDKPVGQFNFTDDGNVLLQGLRQQRITGRNAGRRNNHIRVV